MASNVRIKKCTCDYCIKNNLDRCRLNIGGIKLHISRAEAKGLKRDLARFDFDDVQSPQKH